VAEFFLDPRIEATSYTVGDLPLSRVQLQDDARFPWLVLVPRRPGAVELSDLNGLDQTLLLADINRAAIAVRMLGEAWDLPVTKLNVANLGNVTPQLHWHVVGRRPEDPCWPGPVWGQGEVERLSEDQVTASLELLHEFFSR